MEYSQSMNVNNSQKTHVKLARDNNPSPKKKQWHRKKKSYQKNDETKNKHTSKRRRRSYKAKVPVLRPVGAQVPRAPRNSTQFIMDDHENSSLFVHFHSDEMLKNIEYQGDTGDGSSPFQPTDWLPYNMADFEWTYQTAKEDRMMNASVSDIRKAILGLEAKVSVATQLLEASPSVLLARLQEQLLKLQEENSVLRQKRLHYEHCKKSSSSSSSSSSSTSSSSSSSSSSGDSSSSGESDSECSNPDCETCAAAAVSMSQDYVSQVHQATAAMASEEEKENTCPDSPSTSPSANTSIINQSEGAIED